MADDEKDRLDSAHHQCDDTAGPHSPTEPGRSVEQVLKQHTDGHSGDIPVEGCGLPLFWVATSAIGEAERTGVAVVDECHGPAATKGIVDGVSITA